MLSKLGLSFGSKKETSPPKTTPSDAHTCSDELCWRPWRRTNDVESVGTREGHGSCCLQQLHNVSYVTTWLITAGGYCGGDEQSVLYGTEVSVVTESSSRHVNSKHRHSKRTLRSRMQLDTACDTAWGTLGISPILERDGFTLCNLPIVANYLETNDISMNTSTNSAVTLSDIAIGFGGLNSEIEVTSDLFVIGMCGGITKETDVEDGIPGACAVVPLTLPDGSEPKGPAPRCRHSATARLLHVSRDVTFRKDELPEEFDAGRNSVVIAFEMFIFGGEDTNGKPDNSLWRLEGRLRLAFGKPGSLVPFAVFSDKLEWNQIGHASQNGTPPPLLLANLTLVDLSVLDANTASTTLESNSSFGVNESILRNSILGIACQNQDVGLLLYGGADYGGVRKFPDAIEEPVEIGKLCSKNDVWFRHLQHDSDWHKIEVEYEPQNKTNADPTSGNVMPSVNGHVSFIRIPMSSGVLRRTESGTHNANTKAPTTTEEDSTSNLPATQHCSIDVIYFGGKDFEAGNDDLHIITIRKNGTDKQGRPDLSFFYHTVPCPYLVGQYVKDEEGNGGEGIGVWPHWRYTASCAVSHADTTDVFLVGGQCRHNDTVPVYTLRIQ